MAAKKLNSLEKKDLKELDAYRYITIKDFSDRTTLSVSTVKSMIAAGEIRAINIKGGRRPRKAIPIREYIRYCQDCEND